jgi:hypothetical protein
MKKYILTILSLFFFPLISLAAQIEIEPVDNIYNGDQVKVDFWLKADEDILNAIEGNIYYSNDLLEPVLIHYSNSVISLWIDYPIIENGKIYFSGIIPGGFDYEGPLFSVYFKAINLGKSDIGFESIKMFSNDGKGSEIITKTNIVSFDILENKGINKELVSLLNINDNDRPEIFLPTIQKDKNIFDNKWFLIFNTQDKGSGIDYFEVREISNDSKNDTGWIRTESPYLLKDQGLRSEVYVRAVDHAQNVRVEKISPKESFKLYQYLIICVIILLIIILIYIFFIKSKMLNRKNVFKK